MLKLSHLATIDAAQLAAERILDRKGQNVTILDVRGHATYADFLVIAEGTSDRQVQAIAEHVLDGFEEHGKLILGSEGLREGQWALIDAGDVVVHVFHYFSRAHYDLEAIFTEAPRIKPKETAARSPS